MYNVQFNKKKKYYDDDDLVIIYTKKKIIKLLFVLSSRIKTNNVIRRFQNYSNDM